MYMVTMGRSLCPLIKLSEGYSYSIKNNYVTVVCGSHGERLRPVKVWDPEFDFFHKEKLIAEFVSKAELVYIKVTDMCKDNNYMVDIIRYRLPEYAIGNTELEEVAIKRMKPVTESLFHVQIDKDADAEWLYSSLSELDGGSAYLDAVKAVMHKLEAKDELCYAL